MKECSSCKETKCLTEFSFKNKKEGRRSATCKTCHSEYIKTHYRDNKRAYLDRARVNNARYRGINRNFIWDYLLTHPCVDCGETDPIVLEFDHLRDKQFEVSRLVSNASSIQRVKREVAKCEVRCANCHRRKTAKDFQWWKDKMKKEERI